MEPATSFWVAYGPTLGVALFVLAFGVAAAIARIAASAMLGTFRRPKPSEQHWTVRNARRFQESVVALVLGFSLPIVGALVLWDAIAKTMPELPWVLLFGYGLLRFAVSIAGRRALKVTDDPQHRLRWEWPGPGVAVLVLFGRSFFLALLGTFLAGWFADERWAIALATVLAVTVMNARSGRYLLVALGVLRRPNERLTRLVAETAARLERPAPPCYEVRGFGLNALAWPMWQVVGVTRTALERLDDDEIRSLLLHEFGHLAESPRILRLRSAASFLPLVFLFAPLFHAAFPSSKWLAYFAATSVFFLVSLRLRVGLATTEDDADRFATEHGGNPVAYARALEKLYHHNGFPAVQSARGLHSDLYDRLIAVGVTPEYPRPEAPPRRLRTYAVGVAILVFITSITTAKVLSDNLVGPDASSTTLALNGWQSLRRGWVYGELARRQDDPVQAGALLDIAIASEPNEPVYLMNRAMVAAQTNDCGRAGARLMQGLTALERQEHVPPSLAMWFRSLEKFVSSKCGGEVARNDE